MNRKQKLLLNSMTGLLKELVAIVCGFVLPRFILLHFGSDVNGLVSSIKHFLGFISLTEMGIGPVIQANLYKPLSEKNKEQISRIVKSSTKFFRTIAFVFLVYIGVLAFAFPKFVNSEFEPWYTISLILIIAISTFAQYFFGSTYQLLLNADQKAYIQQTLAIVTNLLNTVFSVVLMELGASIHVVKLVTAAFFVLRPIAQNLYVKKHYSIDRHIVLTEEPIRQKWNGFAQHIASVVCKNIDVVLLTFMSTLSSVSVYNAYYLVTHGVSQAVMTAATGLESFFGNIIAKKEDDTLRRSFETIEFAIHIGVTFLFTIAAIAICPFIRVYTKGITDAEYIIPLFGYMMAFATAMECLRIPYFRVIKAAGHFKETQNGAFISMGLNIVISVLLVKKLGLIGVAIGTFVALSYHTCYFVWYLRSHILNRPICHFIKYLAVDILATIASVLLTSKFTMHHVTYGSWVVYAMEVAAVVLLTCAICYYVFFRKQCRDILKYIKNSVIKKKRRNH